MVDCDKGACFPGRLQTRLLCTGRGLVRIRVIKVFLPPLKLKANEIDQREVWTPLSRGLSLTHFLSLT